MPLSDDPERRERQLRNLPNLSGKPSPASWKPGDAPHLKHGARSRRPEASPEWSPAVRESIRDLEQRVGAELRDEAGQLHAWALPSIESVALQRVSAWRMDRYVADQEARGALRPADVNLSSLVADRFQRALEREALTLRSRLEARATGLNLTTAMALDAELERREREEAGDA